MNTRRNFLKQSSILGAATVLMPQLSCASIKKSTYGVQLYSFRDSMLENPKKTLEEIASLGFKEIESAGSAKGYYYGLTPSEMGKTCKELGMKLTSGHVSLDDKFEQTMGNAVASGQEYLICSSMPSDGQTVENYKKVAEQFNVAGEACKKLGLKFGYHNHEYEFESDNGQVLYDVLMDNTQGDLVYMELDLGWVVVAEKEPLSYFKKYPGRFPLWHLKDMDMSKKESTEFGKGGLDIGLMLKNKELSGVEHIYIEQEEYASSPYESMKYNMSYLNTL
ncbi:sugar phosphate isomerase/epimerase family protein [Maribacter sp. ACAM166]|uniref:sugar phosphate isomerase/epimerase family protein n=1 Tax=Maribacter sp. ACAM166 TaxID=2508996 RepID=UPI0010FF263C|nr:sugar phosphate isomerase/epimerase [Maribacter sp. ACAM166]TLP80369.1 sugar phosphate isomerase/epimerase [Maribacter sp. ACAM166]